MRDKVRGDGKWNEREMREKVKWDTGVRWEQIENIKLKKRN